MGSTWTAAIRLNAFFFFLTGARLEPRFDMDWDCVTTTVLDVSSLQWRTMKRLMNSSKAAISSSASYKKIYVYFFSEDVPKMN